MASPTLSPADVRAILPHAQHIIHLSDGGQKRVFRAEINGMAYAIKFMRPTIQQVATSEAAEDNSIIDDVTARATREVETLQQCSTPYLVKPGPIGLTEAQVNGERLLYFTEEFIDGEPLNELLRKNGPLSLPELVELGTHATLAIQELWSLEKIHRDVKPGNIMQRRVSGEFVLLDMGLVFDLDDRSFSLGPVGTTAYFAPEQVDFRNRRSVLDFRSDTFSLGIVLYQMATRVHPFFAGANSSWEVLTNIQTITPAPPKQLRPDLPDALNTIIMRLLGKRPALRYRTPKMLLDALKNVPR